MQMNIAIDWKTEDLYMPSGHKEALQESGIEQALSMAGKGYVCGELSDNVFISDDDPDDGIDYRGWWKITVTDDPKRQAHTSTNERFSLYGREYDAVTLDELSKDEDAVARVEQSGSEGFYVEVARWNEDANRWERYAFLKVFEQGVASALERTINGASPSMSPIFHNMPNYTNNH